MNYTPHTDPSSRRAEGRAGAPRARSRAVLPLALAMGMLLVGLIAREAGPGAAAKAPPPGAPAGAGAVPAPVSTAPPSPIATPPGPTPSPAPACLSTFGDVQAPDYYYPAVRALVCAAVISGYTCGGPGEPCDATHDPYIRPAADTTRGQLCKLVVAGLAWTGGLPAVATFADVPPGQPFYPFIEIAAARGVISGYTCGGPGEPCDAQNRPYFRPAANVTRGQLSKIIAGAVGWLTAPPAGATFADVAPGSAFAPAVEAAVAHNIISGYSCGGANEPCDATNRPYFRPYADATRGQLSKILYNALSHP